MTLRHLLYTPPRNKNVAKVPRRNFPQQKLVWPGSPAVAMVVVVSEAAVIAVVVNLVIFVSVTLVVLVSEAAAVVVVVEAVVVLSVTLVVLVAVVLKVVVLNSCSD